MLFMISTFGLAVILNANNGDGLPEAKGKAMSRKRISCSNSGREYRIY
jgi:hypothetical protein